MRNAFWHTELIIDTKRYYTIREIFELVRENIEEKFGPIIIKKELFIETISVQGVDGYINKVTSMKWLGTGRGRIIIRQEAPLNSPFKLRDLLWWLLCIATLGLAFIIYQIIDIAKGILNLEGTKANRAMMKTLAEEIEKLVNGDTQH